MVNFKSQILKDLSVFHNSAEFAEIMTIYYKDDCFTAKGVLDHETGEARDRDEDDYAQGINHIDAKLYLSLEEVGFVPERGNLIEIEEVGSTRPYMIAESTAQDGEIILTLEAYDE